MENFVKVIVENLVDNKDAVEVTTAVDGKVIVINIKVDEKDTGKVIGKNGKVVQSIRTIVKSASAKTGKRFIVKIGERD